jgi:hypothetical protein
VASPDPILPPATGRYWPIADPHRFPKADAQVAGFGKSSRSD